VRIPGDKWTTLTARLKELWGDRPCEVCGNQGFGVSDQVHELRTYSKTPFGPGPTLTPLVAAACSRCGNTKLFNAIALGLLVEGTGEFTHAGGDNRPPVHVAEGGDA
jgi:hypothetical protein